MTKHILIVTGSDYTPQVYDAFRRAQQAGHKLYLLSDGSFEPEAGVFAKHYTYDLRKTAEVLSYMKQQPERFDAVTIKTSEWLTPLVALLARQYGCIGNEPVVAFRCRSKYHMRQKLEEYGVPIPPFRLCASLEALQAAIKEIGLPCVAKPVGGNASYGTFLLQDARDLIDLPRRYAASIAYLEQKAISEDVFAFSPEELDLLGVTEHVDMVHDYLVEAFMPGPEISIDALVQDGKVTMMGLAEQVRMAPPFFVQLAEFMPFRCTDETYVQIEEIVRNTVEAMEIRNAPTHTELIFTPEGPKVVEIACRIGGDNIHDAVLQTTGYNLMEEAIMIALGTPRSYNISARCHVAMRYLLPEKAGIIRNVIVPAVLRTDPDVTEIEITAQPGDTIAPPPDSFDFLGYVQARGATRKEAVASLDRALEAIIIEL